jgi:hypothetical protein
MRANQDCTSRTPSPSPSGSTSPRTSPALTTVFTPAFLQRIRRLDNPPSARIAALSGPWEVEAVDLPRGGRRFVVSRREEPFSEGGSVFGVFGSRDVALATAAVLPSVGTSMDLHLNPSGNRHGYKLHDGERFLGHLARNEARLLPRLHLARHLTADPDALALLLEAAGPEALAILGRALHRRIEKVSG